MTLTSVLLPAPLSPTNAVTWPAQRSRFTWLSARTAPKYLVMPTHRRAGIEAWLGGFAGVKASHVPLLCDISAAAHSRSASRRLSNAHPANQGRRSDAFDASAGSQPCPIAPLFRGTSPHRRDTEEPAAIRIRRTDIHAASFLNRGGGRCAGRTSPIRVTTVDW